MSLILDFLDSQNNCAHFTFFTCPCGCGSYGNVIIMQSSLLEDDIQLEIKEEINPLKIASDMLEIFESDFELVNISVVDEE